MPSVNTSWYLHIIISADHFDPHASGVVDMASDHTDGPARGPGDLQVPRFVRKTLEEELRHAIAGSPHI
jgi:hypothetical protein